MFKKTVITIFFIISTSTAYCFLDIYFFDPTGTWVSDSKTITWQPCYRITFKDNGLWEIKSNTVISKIFGSPGERWCSASPSSYSKSGNKIFLYWRPVNFDYDLQFQSQSVQIERAKEKGKDSDRF